MELPSDDEEDAMQDYEWSYMPNDEIEEAAEASRQADKEARLQKNEKARLAYAARQMAPEEQLEEAFNAEEPLQDNNN